MQEVGSYLNLGQGQMGWIELGRRRGREGKEECTLCGAECESVIHVLWRYFAYSSCKLTGNFGEALEDRYSDFDLEKTSYVLGSELWVKKISAICLL